jgi:two-component system sensor histidine kinase CpxA
VGGMRSLFLRIFLWFWVAMVVVGVVLVVTSPYFTQSRSRVDRWQQGAEAWARERVERTAHHISEVGLSETTPGEHRGPGRGGAMTFVFDNDGREVWGREAPPEAVDLARRVAVNGSEEALRRGGFHLVAKPVTDPDGKRYIVVGTLNRPPRPIDLLEPRALWLRLTALAMVVGGLSFLLARYLSSPVGALRRATQQLSEGDLSARVGGRVARRRDEIGELARDFDTMAERLEHLVGSQRRLLRDVSHELRSPLARLRVALELARDRAGAAAGESIDRMEREAARIDDLIGQLLLLERLAAGEPDGEKTVFALAELLGEVVDDASFEASAASREVSVTIDGNALVRGYPALIRSAIDNVLRNAIRHAPESTVIEVALRCVERSVDISVRDRGPGVPEEHLGTLFEPFTRVADARERSSGGAGLGLAIARRAIELHQGTVTARNHPEGGFEVTLHLPAQDSTGGEQRSS